MAIMTVPVSGGKPKELCRFEESQGDIRVADTIAWTPDGKHLLFPKDEDKGASVCRVRSEGGDPGIRWKSKDRVTGLSVPPDGKRIAVSICMHEFSIWVMENFLSGLTVQSAP